VGVDEGREVFDTLHFPWLEPSSHFWISSVLNFGTRII